MSSEIAWDQAFLEPLLTPPRLQHSVGVMQIMAEVAPIYQLDIHQAMAAGLLHDEAKDLAAEELFTLATEAGLTYTHPVERDPIYLHAPVGAYLLAKRLDLHDPVILEAITRHSHVDYAPPTNRTFCWCLRVADLLAPVQPWYGMRKLQRVFYAGRLEDAYLLLCGWLVEYLQEAGSPLHPNLQANWQRLAAELQPTASFFERDDAL